MTNRDDNKIINNMTFVKKDVKEQKETMETTENSEVKNLLNIFESLENRNIEKLEYLIKQVANFIGKFENLENETILEQFEKILYSINNSRLELLEEIAKLSSGSVEAGVAVVKSDEGHAFAPVSEDAVNKFLAELLNFKKTNNSNLSKLYSSLKLQIDSLKTSYSGENPGMPEEILNQLTNNISELKNEANLIQHIVSTQNMQLNQILDAFNQKLSSQSPVVSGNIQDELNKITEELSSLKKSSNTNFKNIYFNLNKKLEEISFNSQGSSDISFKSFADDIAQLKKESSMNSQKITMLLDTVNILSMNISKIGMMLDKNFLESKLVSPFDEN